MSTPEYDQLEAEFPEVIDLLRGGLPEIPHERPSEAVWDGIVIELGATVDRVVAGPGAVDASPKSSVPEPEAGAVVRDISSARSWGRRTAFLTAAAAAVLLIALPLAIALRGDDAPDRRAELAALADFDGTGQAELAGRDLSVRFDGVDAPSGSFYELWLLDLDAGEVNDLRSLGRVEVAADGTFVIPDDVDLDRFDVVDVSVEPDDGDPDHSGASILRGDLTDL